MSRDPRIHDRYGVVRGELAIAGRSVSEWVREAGDTPIFVYDRAIIAETIASLRTAMPDGVGIHYAVKANPLPALVDWIAGQVDGLDVASAGELQIAIASGAKHISFAGPGKRDNELEAAIAADVTLNVESSGEFARATRIGKRLGKRVKAAVRVNPPFDLKASGMRMGGGAKPFGIDADQVPALLKAIGDAGAEFRGFHVFAGSQNLSADAIIETQARTIDLVAELSTFAPLPPPLVNLGGGFGVPYFPGDRRLDIGRVGAALGKALEKRPAILRESHFVLELGRYLVADAGVYLTRVVDRKTSAGETFLVTDGGLHHQLAASGNFGTVVRRNYPIANASKIGTEAVEKVNVVGCLCTPLDKLGDHVDLPESGTGDVIAVFMAGAYGQTASPTSFLGHGPAAEFVA